MAHQMTVPDFTLATYRFHAAPPPEMAPHVPRPRDAYLVSPAHSDYRAMRFATGWFQVFRQHNVAQGGSIAWVHAARLGRDDERVSIVQRAGEPVQTDVAHGVMVRDGTAMTVPRSSDDASMPCDYKRGDLVYIDTYRCRDQMARLVENGELPVICIYTRTIIVVPVALVCLVPTGERREGRRSTRQGLVVGPFPRLGDDEALWLSILWDAANQHRTDAFVVTLLTLAEKRSLRGSWRLLPRGDPDTFRADWIAMSRALGVADHLVLPGFGHVDEEEPLARPQCITKFTMPDGRVNIPPETGRPAQPGQDRALLTGPATEAPPQAESSAQGAASFPTQPEASSSSQGKLPAQPETFSSQGNLPAQPEASSSKGKLPAQPEASSSQGNLPAQPETFSSKGKLPAQPEASSSSKGKLPAQPEASSSQGRLLTLAETASLQGRAPTREEAQAYVSTLPSWLYAPPAPVPPRSGQATGDPGPASRGRALENTAYMRLAIEQQQEPAHHQPATSQQAQQAQQVQQAQQTQQTQHMSSQQVQQALQAHQAQHAHQAHQAQLAYAQQAQQAYAEMTYDQRIQYTYAQLNYAQQAYRMQVMQDQLAQQAQQAQQAYPQLTYAQQAQLVYHQAYQQQAYPQYPQQAYPQAYDQQVQQPQAYYHQQAFGQDVAHQGEHDAGGSTPTMQQQQQQLWGSAGPAAQEDSNASGDAPAQEN